MKKELKGFICGVAATALLFSMTFTTFADTVDKTISVAYRDIKIYVDGNYIQSKNAKGENVEAFIYKGTTYLPVRTVSEALGKEVTWDNKKNSIYIGQMPMQEVTVSTAEQFVKAIGSNKKIILKPGTYDLSKLEPVNNSDNTVVWESVADGQELIIQNVSNMTIQGEEAGTIKFVVSPRYAQIMNFKNSSNITVKNIVAGHTPMEYECDAGVLLFDSCKNISISDSEFYGCGSIGLTIHNTTNLNCDNVNINHCSLRALDIFNSNNITFSNSKIHNHEAYSNIIYVVNSKDILFEGCDMTDNNNFGWGFIELGGKSNIIIDKCTITNNNQEKDQNWGDAFFFKVKDDISDEVGTIILKNTKIIGNRCDFLTDKREAITFDNCTMKDNIWKN